MPKRFSFFSVRLRNRFISCECWNLGMRATMLEIWHVISKHKNHFRVRVYWKANARADLSNPIQTQISDCNSKDDRQTWFKLNGRHHCQRWMRLTCFFRFTRDKNAINSKSKSNESTTSTVCLTWFSDRKEIMHGKHELHFRCMFFCNCIFPYFFAFRSANAHPLQFLKHGKILWK